MHSSETIADLVSVFRLGGAGEQDSAIAPRALEEHEANVELYAASLFEPTSRFRLEHTTQPSSD